MDEINLVSWTFFFPMPISYRQFSICKPTAITYSNNFNNFNNFIQTNKEFLSLKLSVSFLQKYLKPSGVSTYFQYMYEIIIIILLQGRRKRWRGGWMGDHWNCRWEWQSTTDEYVHKRNADHFLRDPWCEQKCYERIYEPKIVHWTVHDHDVVKKGMCGGMRF